MTKSTRDKDLLALKRCREALCGSTSRRMLKANLEFLWDYFLAHPSKRLPKHLKP